MLKRFNPTGLYQPETYWNAVEVSDSTQLVLSSGIIGLRRDGSLPGNMVEQVNQAWDNVAAFLNGIDRASDDIVALKMYYASRNVVDPSREARVRLYGEQMPSVVTGIIVELMDPNCFLEIDLIVAK